jgi:hypothetical protein
MAPTLIYFGIPARAEVARLLFTLGNIDFEASRSTCPPDADAAADAHATLVTGLVTPAVLGDMKSEHVVPLVMCRTNV